MKRLLMTFVIAALCLCSSAFTVNAPQPLTQSALNEYNVEYDNSIKTVGIIKIFRMRTCWRPSSARHSGISGIMHIRTAA